MNVHSWNLKKQVLELMPKEDVESIDSWYKCRDYIRSKNPSFSKKLINWAAQIMYKKLNATQSTLFDCYYAKLLVNKNPKKWDKFELFTHKGSVDTSTK